MSRRLLIAASGASFTLPAPAPVIPTDLFAMGNGQNGTGEYHIGQYTYSASGGTWTQDAANPVLSKSGAGWVSGHVKDPWVMTDGLTVYCSGHNGSRYQIGRATRPDTSSTTWTYDSTTTTHIALGSGGDPDEHGCAFPVVLDSGVAGSKRFKMWYRGQDGSDVLSVCYAYSATGLAGSWTKFGRVLAKGAGGAWDDVGVLPATVVLSGSTYYLFYGGFSSGSAPFFWQGGVATFTDPEGTYTKAGGNPTLTNSVGVSGINQTLTSNTASGSAVVHVSNTSHWSVGMPMLLADGTSESEYHTIASIDSGTQVTLNSVTTSAFNTADGAVIRPFDFISVVGRSVLNATGGYQQFYTPFQPQDDLTTGGTQLREASMRATASSLTGAWTPVYSEGLLFPLFPGTTGWNKFSAENPSVIPAPAASGGGGGGGGTPDGFYIAPTGSDSTGDGTIGSPWATLAHALAASGSGSTIWCRGGTYTGTGNRNITFTATGALGSPLTISAYTGETPIFNGQANGTSDTDRFWLNANGDYSHVVIDGITLQNFSMTQDGIITLSNQNSGQTISDWTISNCDFQQVAPADPSAQIIYVGERFDGLLVEDSILRGPYPGTGVTGGAGVSAFSDAGPAPTNVVVRRTVHVGVFTGTQFYSSGVTGEITHNTYIGCRDNIDVTHHSTILVRDNAGNTGTDANLYDPDPTGTTADHNFWGQSFNSDYTLVPGSTGINAASDGTDAGAIQS